MTKVWVKIGLILLALATAFPFYQNFQQVQQSKKSIAKVLKLEAENSLCNGGGKHGGMYKCTRFFAQVEYRNDENQTVTARLPADFVRGHDASLSNASYSVGNEVKILYHHDTPNHVIADTFAKSYSYIFFSAFLILVVLLIIFKF